MNGHFAKHSSRRSRWLIAGVAVLLCIVVSGWGGSAALAQSPTLTQPNATCPAGGQCFADVPASNPFYTFINRIYMQDLVTGYPCGGVGEPCDGQSRPYYRPVNNVTRQQMAKFIDNARRLPEIRLEGNSGSALIQANNSGDGAILGISTSGTGIYGSSGSGDGVYGFSSSNSGVTGESTSGTGVSGSSTSGDGVDGQSTYGLGVRGTSTTSYGVYGVSTDSAGVRGFSYDSVGVHGQNAYGLAGYFDGDVHVSGNMTVTGNCCAAGAGSSRIDHPLDPANKYLYHSFVESPDMMNVYNGNVTTDADGGATIQLPDYFQTLNRDFRYQLTIMGDQFAHARVSSEIKDNRFSIKTDKPDIKVSWQVTGIRQDPYANAHRIPVEEDKPADEKGKYLHPTEWGQPDSSGIDYEMQQQLQAEMPQAPKGKP